MDTNATVITTMGIISDRVYNQDKGKDYFQIGADLEANGTIYKVVDYVNKPISGLEKRGQATFLI